MRKLGFVFVLMGIVGLIALPFYSTVMAQQDPWWRPLNPYGTSAGVTYGSVAPALATTGMNPAPGELWVDTNGASDLGHLLRVYNGVAGAWQTPGTQIGVGETIIFEGATADNFETIFGVDDPTVGDGTFQLPDNAAAADNYNLMFSLLDTNALAAASSIWFDTDQMIWEGTGVDANEIILTIENASAADITYRMNDNITADIYPVLFTNYADNSWDTTNSVWGVTNGIHFEGVTADDFELSLQAEDATLADQVFEMPDNAVADTYNLMFSILDTNALAVANSIWFDTNMMIYEGASVDTEETTLIAQDPTADVIYQLPDSVTGTFDVLASGQELAYNVELPLRSSAVNVSGAPRHKAWFRTFAAYTGGPPTTAGAVSACNTTAANLIFGPPIVGYGFELDAKGTQTVCGNDWAAADGMGLHNDATQNEGWELTQGAITGAPGAFTIGTSPAFYFRVRWAIAVVANTDQCYAGIRLQQAYDDASTVNYTDYYQLGVGDLADGGAGDWYHRTMLNAGGASNTDIAEADWTNDQVHTVEILVSAAGVTTSEIEGAAVGDATAFTFDNGDVVVPYLFCIADVTAADADIDVVFWETGIQ